MFDLPARPAAREVETDKATRAAERDAAAAPFRGEWYADKGMLRDVGITPRDARRGAAGRARQGGPVMEIKDRLEAMTRDLGTLTFDRQVRYGADAAQRHAHGFSVLCDGERLAEVLVKPHGAEQEKVDKFASVLFHLLVGSEGRVLDREETIANLRGACQRKDRDIAALRDQLAHFERSARGARGPFYAAADGTGVVWLLGRPSWSAWGFYFPNWHDLAAAYPGLRPCGAQAGEGKDAGTIFIVMQPIADLEPRTAAPGPA